MDALRAIDNGYFDLLITDVRLGSREPHGVALARMAHHKYPSLKILFLTGTMNIEQDEPNLPGVTLYKPVDLSILSKKVQDMLSRVG